MKENKSAMRKIPAINDLLGIALKEPKLKQFSPEIIVKVLRKVVEEVRYKLKQEQCFEVSVASIISKAKLELLALATPSLRKAINATGIVLHTNLGRAPLGKNATTMVNNVIAGYCNLEYNAAVGKRGDRYEHIADKLCTLIGAEDAIVVNNNAAAMLLVLSALAKEGEVLVSRGELVEIGGSFRVPEILEQSGAILVEVGTTNKTHIVDYERNINPKTALILKVHTSNYRMVGFTAQPNQGELVILGKRHSLPVVYDLGSGTLVPIDAGSWCEPTVGQCLAGGIDIVTFSGDKLLGAGQAGIIAGKKIYIDKLKAHPLLRAIRIDKLSLAALEGTLIDYLVGNVYQDIPVQRMLNRREEELKELAEELVQRLEVLTLQGWNIEVVALLSQSGGGTLPGVDFKSYGVSVKVTDKSATTLERKLRKQSVPIIARIQEERILFDMRCLDRNDLKIIQDACIAIDNEGMV